MLSSPIVIIRNIFLKFSSCIKCYKILLVRKSNQKSKILLYCREIWIRREKELVQEISAMGELKEPWHSKQVDLLDRHLQLLNVYTQVSFLAKKKVLKICNLSF